MAQAFLTYEQQINLLQNDKELSICDSDFVKTILQKISYYSLIDGYKEPFKPLRSGKFYYATFEESMILLYLTPMSSTICDEGCMYGRFLLIL